MTHSRTPSTLSSRSSSNWTQTELALWRQSLDQFDFAEYQEAYESFGQMEPRAKVLFNMAICAINLNDTMNAYELLVKTLENDPYLSIAAFHLGNLQFSIGNVAEGANSFQVCLKGMRESNEIDYGTLGPDIVLHVADVYCNLGIALKAIGREEEAVEALLKGWDRKHGKEQEIAIFQALLGTGQMRKLPVSEIFRPSATRLQALDQQDYLGSALIVAVSKPTEHIGRIHVKCCMNGEMRLFAIDCVDLRILRQAVINKYGLNSKKFQIKYRDEDGDMIVICDDEDLVRAIRGRFLRIFIVPLFDLEDASK